MVTSKPSSTNYPNLSKRGGPLVPPQGGMNEADPYKNAQVVGYIILVYTICQRYYKQPPPAPPKGESNKHPEGIMFPPLGGIKGGFLPYSGGYSDGAPPLPIPNREVKPVSADGTAYLWESRSPPNFKSPIQMSRTFFCPRINANQIFTARSARVSRRAQGYFSYVHLCALCGSKSTNI